MKHISTESNKIKIATKHSNLKIFLDLDGVIVNFAKGACQILDVDETDPIKRKALKKDNAFDKMFPRKRFDSAIEDAGMEFWEDLELLPWAKKLYKTLNKLGTVGFLTSPGKYTFAPAGKIQFIAKHFNNEDFILCKNKYLCATKDTFLIDDTEDKVKDFKEHGGNAFLWANSYQLIDGDVDLDQHISDLVFAIKT